jgi:hypothetical protein
VRNVQHPKIAAPAVVLAFSMTMLSPLTVLAGGGASPTGQLEVDRTTSVKTAEQQARIDAKLARAASLETSTTAHSGAAAMSLAAALPAYRVLETYARQQKTSYWCGPASAQVAINLSRGYFFSQPGGENAKTNYRLQSEIAAWANTTASSGTSGANLERTLNRPKAILRPTPDWIYIFADHGDLEAYYDKVVADIFGSGMPLISLVRPNEPGKEHHLSSWDGAPIHAGHWIVLHGYGGLDPYYATIFYNDSSEGYQGGTGAYSDPALTMWKVSHYHSDMIIW